MSLIFLPLLGAFGFVLVIYLFVKLLAKQLESPDPSIEAAIRTELANTIWVLEDGTEAVFKNVLECGRFFVLETKDGRAVTALAESLLRADEPPISKEIV